MKSGSDNAFPEIKMKYVQASTLTNSVPNSTVTKLRQATLGKGMWLLIGFGYYTGGIGNTTRASWYILNGNTTIAQFDNTGTYGASTTISCVLYVSSTATVYFDAYQTSGSTQTAHGNSYLNCIRLY